MSKQTILLTGGGTAGHITPLLAVAKQLLVKNSKLHLVLLLERNNPNEQLIKNSGVPLKIHRIFAGKYRRFNNLSLLSRLFAFKRNIQNVRDISYVLIGFVQSLGLMLRYRPRVVFSKGSYTSVPVTLAAAVTFRKIVTHDSDSIPGLANRLVARLAKKNAVGVDSENYKYKKSKIVFTGVPVSDEYITRSFQNNDQSKADIGIPKDCEILFIGGSTQGARVIDNAVERIVPELLKDFPKLHIFHVFGRLNESSIKERYKNISPNLKSRLHLKVFLDDQYKYAAAADLVITRAGATAMAEYGILSKACIVVPAEQLTGGHQLLNSKAYVDHSAAYVISENQLEGELYDKTKYLLQHKTERDLMGAHLKSITPSNAAERLADVIIGEM